MQAAFTAVLLILQTDINISSQVAIPLIGLHSLGSIKKNLTPLLFTARTMTSRSSECSSQLAELVTASPTSMSKVDVAVTLPTGHLDTSYRDKICLTIVK